MHREGHSGTGQREGPGRAQRLQANLPLYQDYATRPIQDGFSWSSSLASCAFERLYLVVLEQSIYRVAYSGLQ